MPSPSSRRPALAAAPDRPPRRSFALACGRAAIVVGYVALFWCALPFALWRTGAWLDQRLGLALRPWPAGWLIVVAGLALLFASMIALKLVGRGLPVSALPPPKFVAVGPYRWVRHPIYLGFHLAIVGWGLAIGSAGLAGIVGIAFLPIWIGYARIEERGLVRRFGEAYRRYRREVDLLPRLGLHGLSQVAARLLLPVQASGREHIPRRGAAILVANHSCYADPVFLQHATWRRIHYLATAEAYRGGALARIIRRFSALPLRRYRVDPVAYRKLLRLLEAGALVGIFPEGERSPLGVYQGTLPHVARMLAHAQVPVIPIGLSGNYDCGPRWAGRLRRRPVRLRIGPPIAFADGAAAASVDRAIRALLDDDPQLARLDGLDRERLRMVLWRCPACLDETGWRAGALHCAQCGARWQPTEDGRVRGAEGVAVTLAELARPVWQADETGPLVVTTRAAAERSMYGTIAPLDAIGSGELTIGPDGLRFGELTLRLDEIRSTTTERADTLQVATADGMWQFRVDGAAFRLQHALDRWRGA